MPDIPNLNVWSLSRKIMFKLDCFGPCAPFHHVGIAVPFIEKAYSVTKKTRDPIQKVSVIFSQPEEIY